MKIYITSVLVDDQAHALSFYTDILGFELKHDIPVGEHRWLTVVSKDEPNGTELLLEPSEHPAVPAFRSAIVADGIPATSFCVDDLDAEHERLTGVGVEFTQDPMDAGPVRMAILDDTCGNLIQLVEFIDNPQ
ncbi:MAG: VOC family protein [Pseudomonadota bacterium]